MKQTKGRMKAHKKSRKENPVLELKLDYTS
jgi:hypothetical protein